MGGDSPDLFEWIGDASSTVSADTVYIRVAAAHRFHLHLSWWELTASDAAVFGAGA